MYVLQNTKTKEFFLEFNEHFSSDTKEIEDAAEFHKASDAHLLMAHLEGTYKPEPKEKFIQSIKN